MKKNYESKIPDSLLPSDAELEIQLSSEKLIKNVKSQMHLMYINEAIEEVMQFIRSINKYLEIKAPWKMVKSNKEATGTVLYTAAEALRISAFLLSPVMPNRTALIMDIFNASGSSGNWGGLKPGKLIKEHKPLFPRL